jgi:hypothetical protein
MTEHQTRISFIDKLICFLYVFTYTDVQHDFHVRWCSCRLIVTRRRVSLVEQEQQTLPEHLSLSPVFSGVHNAPSLVFCVLFCRLFVLFLLAIVLSVLLITPLVPSNSSCKLQISQHNDYHSMWTLLLMDYWSPVYHLPSSLCLALTGFIRYIAMC